MNRRNRSERNAPYDSPLQTLARALKLSAAPLCACALLAGCGGGSQAQSLAGNDPGAIAVAGPAPASTGSPFRFFSASSFWNTPVAADVPLAPNSAELVGALDAQVAALEQSGRGPWINTTAYSVPIYVVAANQPTVRVRLDRNRTERSLQAAWNAVPLPPDAHPASGTDAHLVVWQPSTDRLWEFWRLTNSSGEWHASWGGAMRHASTSSGVYGPAAWPGAKPWWGASASSLSIAGGLITLEDLQRGQINHALAISIPDVRAGVYASPAQRDDGQEVSPLALPEGARLRLDPSLDLAALHLPPPTLLIAEAAQRYGLVVRDRSRGVAFFAQDPITTAANPYAGPTGYFGGTYPNQLLASFPWSKLQVLKLDLHPNGRGSRRGRLK